MKTDSEWSPGPGVKVSATNRTDGGRIVSAVMAGDPRCPACGTRSSRRHGWCVRHLQDLPAQGATVKLMLKVDCALAWAGSPRGGGPDQTAAWSRRDAPGCSAVQAVPAPTVAPPRRVPLACYATRQPHDLPPTPFASRHMIRENDKQRTPTCGRTRGGGCYMMPEIFADG
jgi:hypothetical protein